MPDLRGYDLSSKPGEYTDYTVDKPAADIRDLIRELGSESATVVGHDFGGSVAWTLAMNSPEVVDRLVILNAAHPRKLNEGLKHPSQLARSWYFFYFQLPNLPERHVQQDNWKFFTDFLRDANPQYTEQELDRYRDAWSQPGAAKAMIDYYRAAVRLGSKQKVLPISAPTLVIWGEGDRYLGSDLAEPHAEDVPNLVRRRAPAQRVALGAPRRGRARQRTARRLPRPGAWSPERPLTQPLRTHVGRRRQCRMAAHIDVAGVLS